MISDPNELCKMENGWNSLINKYSENPFLLSGFIEHFMESYSSDRWTPLVIIISAENNIIGVAPLIIKRRFGISSVKFLPPPVFSPDFIIQEEYREKCVEYILNFLFKKMHCHFLDLTMEANSPHLYPIIKQCRASEIRLSTQSIKGPIVGHSILPMCATWDEFCRSRGGNFRRRLKKMERKMNQAGSWRIRCIENENIDSTAIENIFDIEKMSWKQKWRAKRGKNLDENLLMILKASQRVRKNELNFNWSIWFLDLENLTLAYCLVLAFKNIAFFVKTSYDSRYKNLYPGIYLLNEIIHEHFGKETKKINYMNILPFYQTWTHIHQFRTRIIMTKGLIPNWYTKLMRSFSISTTSKRILPGGQT
jgi:hypothetical protein